MRKLSVLALVALALGGAEARAVDFKYVRLTHGPFGIERTSRKVLPGDVLLINYDLTGMTVSAEDGKCVYTTVLQVYDPTGKEIDKAKKIEEKGVFIGVGGTTVPEITPVVFGTDLSPGKYVIKITVTDAGSKSSKQLTQEFELGKKEFGIIHVQAPAIGLKGQDYPIQYGLVDWAKDTKTGLPKITVSVRVLDENNKPTLTKPVVNEIPKDIKVDGKQPLIGLVSPIFLNRPGRFTVVVEATDELGKKSAKLSFPLTVIDPAGK
jgi:hypothetical protein